MSATLHVVNPANEAVIGEHPADDAAAVRSKLSRARAAQPAWAARELTERIEILAKFRDLLAERLDDLAGILTSEMGKPIGQARNEIRATGPRIDYFLENVATVVQPEVVFDADGMREEISYDPLGVVANISAWNYPYFVSSNVFVPALLTGNAVLYKPSEHATLTGLAMRDLLHEAGVPEDVFIAVIGAGATGAALLDQAVDGVFFTGSMSTGRKVAAEAARLMVPCQLELGGKDPAYVAYDVDVPAVAASVADGAFYNTGQSCCAVERVYVHAAIYEQFVEAFTEAVKGFGVGDPTDEGTYIGPLTRGPQREVLEAQVKDAVSKGARLLVGGERLPGPGYWFAPTVLADVSHEMAVMHEESFGPIIGLQRVGDDAEAAHLMNDTEYGLTASVFTSDEERARSVLSHLATGSAYWNCSDRVSPRLPWSGRRGSGLGSTLGNAGIRAFVQPRAWHLRNG